MKLSTRTRYAFHCMLAVSRLEKEGTPATADKIAKACEKPKRYLEQIIHLLKKDALLQSTAGRRGGYRLSRPADKIMLSEIVAATVGPISVVECVLAPDTCDKAETCEFRLLYLLITHGVYQTLGKFSLADMEDGELLASVCRELEQQIAASARNGHQTPLSADHIPSRFRGA